MANGRPILVLSPHPDDESLACGALLAAAFADMGARVLCLTDGARSHRASSRWPYARLSELRRAELTEAVRRLGGDAGDIGWIGAPDGFLGEPAAMERALIEIGRACDRIGPRLILAPSPHDHHEDHKAAAKLVVDAVRDRRDVRVLHYPVWSRWDDPAFDAGLAAGRWFRFPTHEWRARKADAVAAHASQLGRVIDDDPDGFTLDPAFVRLFVEQDELFFEAES